MDEIVDGEMQNFKSNGAAYPKALLREVPLSWPKCGALDR